MMKRLTVVAAATTCAALTFLLALAFDNTGQATTSDRAFTPRNVILSPDLSGPRTAEDSSRTNAGAGHAWPRTDLARTATGGAAVGAFLQAFWTRDMDRERHFPRTNAARDAVYSFYPDTSDASAANIALIEHRAREGSDIALGAFLLVAAGSDNYTARAQDLLMLNAAKGSVLALTTLAGYASIGYGFDHPDAQAAIVYEYLAWRTGMWNSSSLAFVPSLVAGWSASDCFRAMEIADRLVTDSEMFPGTNDVRERNCVASEP